MKILFWGDTAGEGGPNYVNRGIVKELTPNFRYVARKNKYVRFASAAAKCLFCDVTVVSGLSKQAMLLSGIAKAFGKKVVYIMHGCVAYESVVNLQSGTEAALKQEEYLLKNADLLLPVSKKFRNWVQNRYPQYAHKAKYLYNGIEKTWPDEAASECPKIKGSVAASGADRGVKNNIVVARAVERMNGKAMLTVYGTVYHKAPEGFRYAKYVDRIPRSEFFGHLRQTELFVANSIFDTFNLSVIEALQCGCSVLVSEAVGVTDLLALEENDLIHDPMDEDEIGRKIRYLLENPNHHRILSQLDLEQYSFQKSVERLEKLCTELIDK